MAEGPGRSLRIGVARVDASGHCTFVNDDFAKILGFAREQILGDDWRLLVPDAESRMPELWDELRAGRSVLTVEIYARSDGRQAEIQLESFPELDADGRVSAVLLTCVDLSAQERVSEEIERNRARASDRLEELEDLYQNTPVGLCAVDVELRYVRTNRHYAETVGYAPSDLLGRTMHEVIPASARDGAVGLASRVIASGEPELDCELRRVVPGKPELDRVWLANVHPVRRDGEITGAMAALQNVTGLFQAEDAARASLRELESVYANSPVGLTLLDRDLRYVRVNQVIADMNGLTIGEVIGKSYRDLAPDTADLAERFLGHVLETGQSVRNLEVRARPPIDPEREHIYLLSIDPMRNAEGEVTGLLSAVQDVTKQRRIEEVAALRLEQIELVYATVPAALCHMDADLRVLHLNQHFARLHGTAPDEQIGRPVAELLPAPLAERLVPELREVVRTGTGTLGLQLHGRVHDAGEQESSWIASAHPARHEGTVSGVIAVLQDVTALANRQREVEAVRDRLEEAQRVARVGSWEWDMLKDEVWWSRELFEIFGESPDHVPTYEGFFERVHPTDRAHVREQVENTLRDERPYRLTHRILRNDGSEGVIFSAARLERTPEGLPARMVGTCQDITEFGPNWRRGGRRRRRRNA